MDGRGEPPMPGPGDVRIAWAPLPPPPADAARRGAARRAVAWRLLRELLGAAGAEGAVLSNPCPRCGGPHGPVRVDGAPWLASVSYTAGWAVVAICPAGGADGLGVDAVAVEDAVRDAAGWAGVGATSALSWARVEAAHKADGRGLRLDPRTTTVRPGEDGGAWRARLAGRAGELVGWEPARAPPGVVVSVAVSAAPAAPARRATP